MGVRANIKDTQKLIKDVYSVLIEYTKDILPKDSFYITEFLKRSNLTDPEILKKFDYNGVGIRWKSDVVEFKIIENGTSKDIETVKELFKVIELFNDFVTNLFYKATNIRREAKYL